MLYIVSEEGKKFMKICGFQKLTLLDYPGKTAATIFCGGCNFRCPFCHNGDLVLNSDTMEELSKEEIISFLSKRKGLLDGVCITGGEPLIWQDIRDFIKEIKELGFLIKLDTNGYYPDRLKSVSQSGNIDYIAMDIKNSPHRYSLTSGLENFDIKRIEESVEFIKNSGIDHEFRTTVVKGFHTENEMEEIGKWLLGEKRYFIQPYKESEKVIDKSLSGFDPSELEKLLEAVKKYIPTAELRGV